MSAYSFLYNYYGNLYGVDPALLRAVALVESAENPLAISPVGAIGLMQIWPRANFYDIDGHETLDIQGWPVKDETELFNPALSVKIGAQVLARNIKDWGTLRGIAIYNMWSARKSPVDGPFPNQSYVDKVLKYYG